MKTISVIKKNNVLNFAIAGDYTREDIDTLKRRYSKSRLHDKIWYVRIDTPQIAISMFDFAFNFYFRSEYGCDKIIETLRLQNDELKEYMQHMQEYKKKVEQREHELQTRGRAVTVGVMKNAYTMFVATNRDDFNSAYKDIKSEFDKATTADEDRCEIYIAFSGIDLPKKMLSFAKEKGYTINHSIENMLILLDPCGNRQQVRDEYRKAYSEIFFTL